MLNNNVLLPEYLCNKANLYKLYQIMALIRAFDKKAIALQRTGKMGTYAPVYGQEAIATAIGFCMQAEDVLVPYYRDYAAQIQRGVELSEILAFWGGDERGSQFINNTQDLPICVPIASQCLHAAGVAFAFKHRNEQRVAVVSLGDGGTSEGDFYEAINIAGVWKLPIVFIVNNNQWAISVPLSQQTACKTLAQKAIAAGFNGIQVDGNDILACTSVIHDAILQARAGEGPMLIEALSYRLSDHTTADDATRYQPSADVAAAHSKEPLLRFRQYLEAQHAWTQELETELQANIATQVQQEVDKYLSRPRQAIQSIFDYHYSTLPYFFI